MNAYELADALQETEPYYSTEYKLFDKTANMLRQQADELEAFKLNFYNTGYTLQLRDKDETIRQQADRISELEAELGKQGEPVAWTANKHLTRMNDGDDVGLITKTKGIRVGMFPFDNPTDYDIPLYTAPQTNAEPVGRFYWESVVDGHVMAVPSEGTPHYNNDDFPLYTTPQTKPLSDDEILKIYDDVYVKHHNDGIDFARAIEERHGIK